MPTFVPPTPPPGWAMPPTMPPMPTHAAATARQPPLTPKPPPTPTPPTAPQPRAAETGYANNAQPAPSAPEPEAKPAPEPKPEPEPEPEPELLCEWPVMQPGGAPAAEAAASADASALAGSERVPGEAEVDAGVARLLEEVAAMQLRRTGEVLDAVMRRGAALLGGKGGKGGKHVHASFVARRGGAAAERAEKAGKEVGLSVRVAGCGWQQPLPASEELAPSRSLLRSGRQQVAIQDVR